MRELDSLDAVAGLGADLEPGASEHLDQVEPDDRLVFGDQDAHRSSVTDLTRAWHGPVSLSALGGRGQGLPGDAREHLRAPSGREQNFSARTAVASQLERPLQLVADERSHDRQAGATPNVSVDSAVVADREQCASVAGRQLDSHLVAAVLESVLEELTEDKREGGCAIS